MSRGKTDTLPLHLQCACHPFIESSDTQFWTSLCTMDVTSDECLSKVQTLLTCPFMIALVRSFRGNQAQMLVDFLHHVLSCSRLDKKLWQRCLRLLSKICNAQAIIPASYILQHEVTYVGSFHEHGGFAEVSNGQYLGRPVAIKNLKMNKGDPDKMFKRFCREVVRWKHLSHPNILPLLGVSVSTDPPRFRIFSEWMPNRNVIKYATSNPEANRLRLLSEVASGVAYLHELKVVHGDLKGENILVDNSGAARVADFGLMCMTDLSTLLSESDGPSGGSLRWMSPELLDTSRSGSKGRPTRESDCYALGMVIYEVLTGCRPFHHLGSYTPVVAVMRGERPQRPRDAESLGFSNRLWELVQLCWSELTSTRPTARDLRDHLSRTSVDWNPSPTYPISIEPCGSTDPDSSSSLRNRPCDSWGVISGPCRKIWRWMSFVPAKNNILC